MRALTEFQNQFLFMRERATLQEPSPETTGEEEPVWAQPHFSHRFTGVVPVEQYEFWPEWEDDRL